ncbi:hypothetical protein IKE71_02020 [Candidatus Saccharibacteria bacterium]|nr:hypothetical protein [Candidatus Saccharibacteria bacterium]
MNFDFGAFFIGLLILAGGGACVVFYRPIAENLAHGVHSYDKVKLAGIIAIALGFLIMTNLHTAILTAFVKLIFPR